MQSALKLPAGLTNLGNTCYLNATVQCFKTVPELRNALLDFDGGLGSDDRALASALRDLYRTMDRGQTIPPLVLVQLLHNVFPRFAERGEQGGFQQQDANECWVSILYMKFILNSSFVFCQFKKVQNIYFPLGIVFSKIIYQIIFNVLLICIRFSLF